MDPKVILATSDLLFSTIILLRLWYDFKIMKGDNNLCFSFLLTLLVFSSKLLKIPYMLLSYPMCLYRLFREGAYFACLAPKRELLIVLLFMSCVVSQVIYIVIYQQGWEIINVWTWYQIIAKTFNKLDEFWFFLKNTNTPIFVHNSTR